MRGHLTDTEMAEALDEAPSGAVRDHLASCPTCRAERDRLQATLTGLAAQMQARAARPAAAWDQQARQIADRLHERQPRAQPWRWAWAPAVVGLAVLAGFWFYGQSPRMAPGTETDDALLVAVERSIHADVPAALRPAALLVGEVGGRGTEAEQSLDGPQGGG
jgi:predicted anti-sigma-YlaC factor YlaD